MLKNKPIRFTFIDIAAIAFIVAAIFLFFSRMVNVLEYKWEWDAIPPYFFYLDNATGKFKANILVKGFAITVKLSIWATLLGFFLGIVSGIMGAKGSFEQRFISRTYVETIRNIPSLVLVIIFYYFISSQFLDALNLDNLLRNSSSSFQQLAGFLFAGPDQINSFISAVIALGIYEGAYVSEIIRGGINAIPAGQWEASLSIGLTRKKAFLLVVLPQTLRKVLFPLLDNLYLP